MAAKQKIKVRALIDHEYEFEIPHGVNRNAFIRTQILEALKPTERLIEMTVIGEHGKPIDKQASTFFGGDENCKAQSVGIPRALWKKDFYLESAIQKARKAEVGVLQWLPGSPHREIETKDINVNQTQYVVGSHRPKTWPRKATNDVPLTQIDHDALKNAQAQLDATEERWSHRRTWMHDNPEDFEILTRERTRHHFFITSLLQYGAEIAERRVSKHVKKSETSIGNLRQQRDTRTLDRMMKDMEDLSVDKTETSKTSPPTAKPYTNNAMSSYLTPIMDKSASTATKRNVLEQELRRQRDRSRSPGRPPDTHDMPTNRRNHAPHFRETRRTRRRSWSSDRLHRYRDPRRLSPPPPIDDDRTKDTGDDYIALEASGSDTR